MLYFLIIFDSLTNCNTNKKRTNMEKFKANGLPLLIGSLPMESHEEATKLVLENTPDIPLWVQLPGYQKEGMISQFLPGLPGFSDDIEKNILDTSKSSFDEEFLDFFEEYLSISEAGADIQTSRFALSGSRARGFVEFLKQIDAEDSSFKVLKGQVTGPITFGTAVKDENDKDIFYNDQLRDAAIKKLAMNARWQAHEFAKRGALPIIFLDEPALAGFGTSAYITITKEDVTQSIDEIVQEIHTQNGLAGVHVCANTQWDMLLDSTIDIISFDAFSYFDKFILYPELIKTYFGKGKILAWGIVPTHKSQVIAEQTTKSLVQLLNDQMDELHDKTGIDKKTIISQSFITPSCGTGSLDLDSAKKVLKLTKEVSQAFRLE
jgi:methionine synthase II (cobalamin-independent)